MQHHSTPRAISKAIRADIVPGKKTEIGAELFEDMPAEEILNIIIDLEAKMQRAAKQLEFEEAAALRDRIKELRLKLEDMDI